MNSVEIITRKSSFMLIENLKSFTYPILWGLFILALSIGPGPNLPNTFDLEPDKLAHAFVYGVLVWLFLYVFQKQQKLNTKRIVVVIVGCALYGLLLEIIQKTFFPHRYFELGDAIANTIGAVLGYLIFRLKKANN